MFIRLPLTIIIGTAISIAVFWLLWYLISQPINVGAVVQATRIEFTRMRKDTEVKTRQDNKVERKPPPQVPQAPQMTFNAAGLNNNVVSFAPQVNTGAAVGTIGFSAGTDSDVVPLVRIPPQYPPRALSRGIQGWVQIQFTITETGAVKDEKVVAAQPKDIFNQAALQAISRWRYNPRVVDGQPVPRVGVQTVIRFKLSN